MTADNDQRDAIIHMQNKIRVLVSVADPDSEYAQALHHSEQQNPCAQIVGKLLKQRVSGAQDRARRAASTASRKCWCNDRAEKDDTQKLIREFISCISLMLDDAQPRSDSLGSDFTGNAELRKIYDVACYAEAFTGIVLKACTRTEVAAPTALPNRDGAGMDRGSSQRLH